MGRPDDGTDPAGFYNARVLLPLKPLQAMADPPRRMLAGRRTKEEMIDDMDRELTQNILGVDWNFSQNIRNNGDGIALGRRGENSVKIIGPDLHELEQRPTGR